jgi:hypothetical protein
VLSSASSASLRLLNQRRISGGPHHLVFSTTGKTPVLGFSKTKCSLDELITEAAKARVWPPVPVRGTFLGARNYARGTAGFLPVRGGSHRPPQS